MIDIIVKCASLPGFVPGVFPFFHPLHPAVTILRYFATAKRASMKTPQPGVNRRLNSSHWGAFSTEVTDGRLTGVTGFEKDPAPSPMLEAIPGVVYSEARVRQPMVRQGWLEKGPGGNREKRGGEPFVPVSWDKALELVSGEISRVSSEFGNQAIFAGSYGWGSAGVFHFPSRQLHRFLNTVGGFTGSMNSYSTAAAQAIIPHVLGSMVPYVFRGNSYQSIVDNTELMVLFGGLPISNTQVSYGGMGEHTSGAYLRAAKANGVQFVNVNPVLTDTPDFLDAQWLGIRPNTDTALMLGLAHTLVSEGLHNTEFLARYCTGYAEFEAYLLGKADGQPKTAEWAAAISDIAAETIRALARRMAASRTLIATTHSLQRGDHGEQPFWMTVTLAAMLGEIGLPGGGFSFGYGSLEGYGNDRREIGKPSLPPGKNPIDTWIPVARISDLLLHPGETYTYDGKERVYPDIRMVYWCGGNPFHHHQDLNRLVRAWRRPETIVVNDPFWTATARHADIVLPATTTLERNDIGTQSADRFILSMEKVIDPVGDARNDHDIFSGLAERLGTREAFTEGRDEMEWVRHLYDTTRERSASMGVELPTFETFREKGYCEIPPADKPYVMLQEFREAPDAHPLKTPSGRIEIFSQTVAGFGYADCPGHPAWLEPGEWLGAASAARYPLHMISSQPRTRLHSQMDQGTYSRAGKIAGREPIRIHPDDAAARGVADGDIVRVHNERGSLLSAAIVSGEVRPGVVQLPTGAWYDPLEPGVDGSLDKHGNPNVLTLDKGTSQLGQGPIAQSALVEVEKYDGDLPEITAHHQPATVDG